MSAKSLLPSRSESNSSRRSAVVVGRENLVAEEMRNKRINDYENKENSENKSVDK